MATEYERGVQVVRVSTTDSGTTYQLDEKALAALLLHEDVADCRVALVSVAGAYRGGKSFLLDFLLRYLRAEEAQRLDSSWLGAEREELCGFNWRGGSERDTTGLWLWSRPARLQLPCGESVAVLLMDTQGTFDCRSTVRDCSTIFALSTLLSSVQIYNLKENIKEDDLQYLQLFSEYGRMALESNDGSKPFQSLHFLIRDWAFGYEYPYGADGGKRFLEKRLEITEAQASELQEHRQHIRACFDTLDCFLMPHPGFAVCDVDFKGHLNEIRTEFKQSLKELVPLILEPKNLIVKKINGQPIKCRDLFYHFKEYMKIFNSDKLPIPLSILNATAEAGLLSGVATARAQYKRVMDHIPVMSRETLQERHTLARNEAVQTFVNKKTMADVKDVDAHALKLVQEFDTLLPNYVILNDAKIQKAITKAKQKYNKMVLGEWSMENLCLHPRDLKEAHRRGLEDAIRDLDLYTGDDSFAKSVKADLVRDLKDRFKVLSTYNEGNNKAAVSVALDEYCTFIESTCGNPPCVTAQELTRRHQQARACAQDSFRARRNRYIEYNEDFHRSLLTEAIEEKYLKLKAKNEENNETAVQEAINAYKEYMTPEDDDHRCFHPEDLKQRNEKGQNCAFYVLSGRSTAPRSHAEDEYKQKLRQELNKIFQKIEEANIKSNISAVKQSYDKYCKHTEETNYVMDWYLNLKGIYMVEIRHYSGLEAAFRLFREKRHTGPFHLSDQYRECLEKVTEQQHQYNRFALRFMWPRFSPPWAKNEDWWANSLGTYLLSP